MDRLSVFLTLVTGSVLTGALIITAFTLGYYGWAPILICAVIGFALAWPAGFLVSRRIKRQDPGFDETRIRKHIYPDPMGPEV